MDVPPKISAAGSNVKEVFSRKAKHNGKGRIKSLHLLLTGLARRTILNLIFPWSFLFESPFGSCRVNYHQLKRLVDEACSRVAGSRVQKVYHPDPGCLQIGIYAGGSRGFLTFRTSPGLVSFYLAEKHGSHKGEAASGFCMKMRSHLEGALLESIGLEGEDRFVNVIFSGREKDRLRLVAELFGVGANCYLLAGDGRIMAVMDPRAALGRENREGAQYTAPPPPKSSPPELTDDPIEENMARRELATYNQAAEAYYEELAERGGVEQLRARAVRELSGQVKKLEKICLQHEQTIAQAPRADWLRECGDILSANFKYLRKGLALARLPDYYAEKPGAVREIPLDESLPPQDNVERYFKRAKKIKSGVRYARSHLAEVLRQLEELRAHIERLSAAGTEEELKAAAEQAGVKIGYQEKKAGRRKPVETRLPYRRFRSEDGSLILVGRGPRDNDELTFHVANGRDLWLHVAGATGSHVILACQREGDFSEQALLDAAHLAAFFSSRRDEPVTDVDYTQRKNVSKPPGLPPGRAVIASRRTLHLRLDQARLTRLLGRRRDFQPDEAGRTGK